jgi:hypothetical protein
MQNNTTHDGSSHLLPSFELRTMSCEHLSLGVRAQIVGELRCGARDARIVLAILGRASEDAYCGLLIFLSHDVPSPFKPSSLASQYCNTIEEDIDGQGPERQRPLLEL